MTTEKRRIHPGKALEYSTSPLQMPKEYERFSEMYDWCESNYGPYNHNWSIIWNPKDMLWTFADRGDLTRFLLVWY